MCPSSLTAWEAVDEDGHILKMSRANLYLLDCGQVVHIIILMAPRPHFGNPWLRRIFTFVLSPHSKMLLVLNPSKGLSVWSVEDLPELLGQDKMQCSPAQSMSSYSQPEAEDNYSTHRGSHSSIDNKYIKAMENFFRLQMYFL
ncbi:hypothetical protein ILYODFUR_016865 [Ilyodon furcidens]|uniref:Uncharacterized protein n=1 Tax=Ilyodon furcidens TaxID=33524 RepID=A0ABV0VEK9_9TELE